MRAGLLRTVITIQTFSEARNAYGEPIKSWENFATVRAEVVPFAGTEAIAAGQLYAKNHVRIRMRYLAGVTEKMRVLLGSQTLDIRSIANMGTRGRMLELMCEVNDGAS